MKKVIDYINEVKFGTNKKPSEKKYKVYKHKIFNEHYAKVNSEEEFDELVSNDDFDKKILDEAKKAIADYGNECFKYGLFIRPSQKYNGTKSINGSTPFDENELKRYVYVTDITANQFSVKGWKDLGYSIKV